MSNSIPIKVTPLYLWVTFDLLCIFTIVVAATFLYHWRNYEFKDAHAAVTKWVFLSGIFLILGLSVVGIIIF
ncbi:MAG: hypothetical protein EXS46_03535 [Candidatus Taylorbacteria bacterium]|nr:hypothetical protein [Candidatus Taylorbacteria bacterium]